MMAIQSGNRNGRIAGGAVVAAVIAAAIVLRLVGAGPSTNNFHTFVAFNAGRVQSLAIRGDGSIVIWGCGRVGALTPTPPIQEDSGECDIPADLKNVIALATGRYHSMALDNNGRVWAWGCGNPNSDFNQCIVPPEALSGVVAIGAGVHSSFALKYDGTVLVWGCSFVYPGGTPVSPTPAPTWTPPPTPTPVPIDKSNKSGNFGQCDVPAGLGKAIAIDQGDDHDVAIMSNGEIISWGCGSTQPELICIPPTSVTTPGTNILLRQVGAGGSHTIAILPDLRVYDWGCSTPEAFYGQCMAPTDPGAPGTPIVVTDVAAGWYAGLALRPDGTVITWGCRTSLEGEADFGQCIVPPNLGDVVSVSGGFFSSGALKRDGSIIMWGCSTNIPGTGDGDAGQCNVPTP